MPPQTKDHGVVHLKYAVSAKTHWHTEELFGFMVARSPAGDTARTGFLTGCFVAWRQLLTRVKQSTENAAHISAKTVGQGVSRARSSVRQGGASAMDAARRTGAVAVAAPAKTASEMGDSVSWLFSGWKRVLARVGTALSPVRPLKRIGTVLRDAASFVRHPATLGHLEANAVKRVTTVGVGSLFVGALAGVAVGRFTSGSFGVPTTQALGMLIWAVARLAILMALAPRSNGARSRTYTAWAVSLIPFALGATEGLRLIALLASAWLCLGALNSLDESPQAAKTMVLWAFGGQVGVVALGWLLRGGIAALASLL